MSEIAIKIEDLSLIFSLSDSGPKQIFRTFLGPIGKKIFGKGRSFTALRNIDFEISKNNIKLFTNMNYDFELNALIQQD